MQDAISVLHVEGDPDATADIAARLEGIADGIDPHRVEGREEALARLEAVDVDCVLSDAGGADRGSLEFLDAVRSRFPDLPYVVVADGEETAAEALAAGATDVVEPGEGSPSPRVLANRIRNAVKCYRAERSGGDADRWHERLVEAATEVVLVLDRDGRIRYVSPAVERVLGYDPESVVGEAVVALAHPDDREAVRNHHRAVVDGDPSASAVEFRCERADGSWLAVECRARNLLDDPTIEGVVASIGDATARRRELSRYESIVEASGDAVYALDTDGRFTFVNEAHEDLTGYQAEELIGEHVGAVMADEDVGQGEALIRELLGDDEKNCETFEMDVHTAEGDRVPVENHIALLTDERGEFQGTTGVLRDVSERKERERDLERNARLVEAMGDGLYAMDAEGRYTLVNDHLLALNGYDREEVLGAEASLLHDDADIERFEAAIADLVSEGGAEVETVEASLGRADGREVPIEVNLTLLPDADGEFRGTVGVVRDITERKERERELEQYERIVETVPDGLFVVDEEATVVDANEAAARLLGRDREEMLGEPFMDVAEDGTVDEELVDQYEDAVRRLLSSDTDDELARVEFGMTADGERRFFEGRIALRPFEEEFRGTVGVVRDVTERREREMALERYERIVEASGDGVYALDEEGRYTFMNQANAEVLNYEIEELLGEHVSTIMDEADIERSEALIRDLLSSDRDHDTLEIDVITSDGDRVTTENHIALLTDADGRFRGTTGIIRDITERKRRERRLNGLNELMQEFLTADSADEVAAFVVEAAGDLLGFDAVVLALHDGDERALVPGASSPEAGKLLGGVEPIEPGDGLAWEAFESGDILTDDGPTADAPVGRRLACPVGDHGVLLLGSAEPGELGAHGVSVAEILAHALEAALDRAEHLRELRKRQRELEMYETAVESTSDGIALMSEDAEFLLVNSRFASATGSTKEEIEGTTVDAEGTDVVVEAPDDLTERWVAAGQEAREEGRSTFEYESKVDLERGLTTTENSVTAISQPDGSVLYVLVTRDVTDRVEREAQIEGLHESTRELMAADSTEAVARRVGAAVETTLDFPANLVRLADEEAGTLEPTAVSDRASELLGEPPTVAIQDHPLGEAFANDESLRYDDIQAETDAFEDSEIGSALCLPIGEYGTLSIVDEAVGAYEDSDVRIAEILTANAERAFERVEREEALRERERALSRQIERLDQFASIVSHDLRNPLNVAQGHLSFLREEVDGEDHVEEIAEAHARMNAIIEDVLTLAREGDEATDVEAVDLAATVDACWGNVDTREATLDVEADRTIMADESRLQQLFENLVRNAVEHAGEDVTVRVGDLAEGFYVEDDGPGIPEADRDEVFDAGYSTGSQGTGFGLNIVKTIAEAHEWDVSVTEGSDGGARFEVTGVEPA